MKCDHFGAVGPAVIAAFLDVKPDTLSVDAEYVFLVLETADLAQDDMDVVGHLRFDPGADRVIARAHTNCRVAGNKYIIALSIKVQCPPRLSVDPDRTVNRAVTVIVITKKMVMSFVVATIVVRIVAIPKTSLNLKRVIG